MSLPTGKLLETFPINLPGRATWQGRLYATVSRSMGRRLIVCDEGGFGIFDSGDQYDLGNARHALDSWLSEQLKPKAAPVDPSWPTHDENGLKPPSAAPAMSPEEQEKALAILDERFEADRQRVVSEVMGMVGEAEQEDDWTRLA